jgi:ketosteroid isomerase-like protein
MIRESLALIVLALTLPQAARAASQTPSNDLFKRDEQWAALCSKGKNIDEIVSYWTDSAVLYLPGQPSIYGKKAIRKFIKDSFATPGFHISWEPQTSVSDGKLGYTMGITSITVPGPKGKPMTMKERYVTTWTRLPDGKWYCTVDISNSDH